jgi:hypothetical protein
MIVRSVSAHLEKILSQRVSRIIKAKRIIDGRDDAVLSPSLTSVSLGFVTNPLVHNTVREDIVIALNAHDEGTEFQVLLWC